MRAYILITLASVSSAIASGTPTSDACQVTVTNTVNGGIAGGCKFDCATTPPCVADYYVTVPCGCDSAQVVTKTETVCPTQSPCYNCYTAYPFTTTASNCP